jgi:hypothetical protein
MNAEEYLAGSRLFRRPKNGSHGQLIERYGARLVDDGLAQIVTLRPLRLIGDFSNKRTRFKRACSTFSRHYRQTMPN